MSAIVVSVSELGDSPGTLGANVDTHSHQRRFLVKLSAPDPYGWLIAQGGTGIPARSSTDTTTGLCCVGVGSVAASGDEAGINWIVTCNFKDDPIAASSPYPWLRKDKVEDSNNRYQVPMEQDFNSDPAINGGNPRPVVNSCKDRPATPLHQEAINPFFRVRRWRRASEFDYAAARLAQDSINLDDFTIKEITGNITVAAGSARLHSVIATPSIWYAIPTPPATVYTTQGYDIVMEIEVAGQYAAAHGGLATVLVNNMGVYCYTDANNQGDGTDAGSVVGTRKTHAWHGIPDPDAPTNLRKNTRGATIQLPCTQPVFLNADGSRCNNNTSATDLLTKTLKFTRFPTIDWSSFIV